MAPASREFAVQRVEAAFDRKLDEVFVEFGEAVAAASIAQVHRAKVRDADGTLRDVAVKVLRPVSSGGSNAISATCSSPRGCRALAAGHAPPEGRDIVDTLARSVRWRWISRLEAAAASRIRRQSRERSRLPLSARRLGPHGARSVHDGMDRRRAGSDPAVLEKLGFDAAALGRKVIQSFLPPRRSTTAFSTPTCTPAISSSTPRDGSSRSISGIMDG